MSQSFSFVQISDIHVGITTTDTLTHDLRQIEAAVDPHVAFVVNTGDLTDHGAEEEFRNYLEAVRATSLKIYPVVGNHDYEMDGRTGIPQNAGHYERLIAPLNYSFDHQGVHFVAYDSIIPASGKRPTPWLLEDLSKLPAGAPIIFLVHYPLEGEFYRHLQAFNIVATLSGHWHTSRLFHDGKIMHFNTPTLCFGGIDYSSRCYRVFTWDGQHLAMRTVLLKQSVPASGPQDLTVRWKAPLGGEVLLGAPVVRDGRVFVSLMNESHEPATGGVGCWDAASGTLLWQAALPASVKNSPAYFNHTVFVVTVTGQVVALDAATGHSRWNLQLGDASQRWIFSSPTAHNGRLYTGHGQSFTALDAATGQCLFVRDDLRKRNWLPPDWISSCVSPVVSGDRVLIGFFGQPEGLQCLDAQTGKTLWKVDDDHLIAGTPALDDAGNLYVARGKKTLHKMSVATGKTLQEFPVSDIWSPATPLVQDGVVYAASGNGKLFAFDVASGQQRWLWESGVELSDMLAYRRNSPALLSSPQSLDEQIVIGCNDGRLIGLDKTTGTLRWSHQFNAPISTTPAIVDDTIYLPVRNGYLYALQNKRADF